MSFGARLQRAGGNFLRGIRDLFMLDYPSVGAAVLPLCLIAVILYTRHPMHTNFIFDEQEALLANPYVRSVMDANPKFHWLDAFKTDFWGRGPDATIGSYRPIPNLIWRAVWWLTGQLRRIAPQGSGDSPFLCHWVNVILHGLNGAVLTGFTFQVTKRRDIAWFAGATFVMSAVLTEAVSGVVGLSDVLGGLGALIALMALTLPMHSMPLGVFLGVTIGMYSKESALCCVPLIPLAAVLTAHSLHPGKPRRILRGLFAFAMAMLAFVLYVQVRKKLFHTEVPSDLSDEKLALKSRGAQLFGKLLRWYAQPSLPRDSFNNPLVEADAYHRIAGALRVYARGLGQVVFPWKLSGDYSSPQEAIPPKLVFTSSVTGALAIVVPVLMLPIGFIASVQAYRRRDVTRSGAWALAALAGIWIVLSYFPVSNIPILLPTVRAERFWYFPAVGTSLLIAIVFGALLKRAGEWGKYTAIAALVVMQIFAGMQFFAARRHANEYRDDLTFWEATSRAVPNSAKAHLNYSVMLGARSRYDERLVANRRALELEPTWAMANVYLGDTLCRMHRAPEAIPHYLRGFELGANEVSLIALALQCLWDEKLLTTNNALSDELNTLANQHPGTWYAEVVNDLRENGEKNNGVAPKHRPRGYNEGPKD
jgi:hypothetical protein